MGAGTESEAGLHKPTGKGPQAKANRQRPTGAKAHGQRPTGNGAPGLLILRGKLQSCYGLALALGLIPGGFRSFDELVLGFSSGRFRSC